MSTEADIVERLRERSLELAGRSIDRGCQDSGISANLCDESADLITKLRAERAAAARDMRERCAKIADEYDSDNAEDIASEIRTLPDSQTVMATQHEGDAT